MYRVPSYLIPASIQLYHGSRPDQRILGAETDRPNGSMQTLTEAHLTRLGDMFQRGMGLQPEVAFFYHKPGKQLLQCLVEMEGLWFGPRGEGGARHTISYAANAQ